MACTNFDIEQHRLEAETVLRSIVLKSRNDEQMSVTDFVQSFYTTLKNTGLFNLESEAEFVSLSKVFEDFIKTSRRLPQSQKEQLLAEYSTPLSANFGVNPETSTIEITDKDLVIKDTPEDVQVVEQSTMSKVLAPSLNDLYGSATVVQAYMQNQFRYNIIEASLVNFTDGKLVKSNEDLNLYIAKFKNNLFKKLVDYIKLANKEEGISTDSTILDTLYLNGVPNIPNMNKVLDMASEIFKDLPRSKLDSAYISKKRRIDSIYKDQMLVDGFNAWAILSNGNFDTILKSLFGKNMEIRNKGYLGIEIPVTANKYQFKSSSNMVKTWRTNENVDAMGEIGNVSKLLIEQTPVLSFATGEQIGDNYLTLKHFLHTMNKIKDEANFYLFGENLQKLVLNLHSAPNYYLERVLKEILTNSTRSRVFQVNDLNVIRSVYDKFYNKDKYNSLFNIINRDYQESKAITTYSLLDSVSGVVDRTSNARYIEYAMNMDINDLDSTEIKQSNVNRRKIQRENDIDIANELQSDRNKLLTKWGVQVTNALNGEVSFKVPYKDSLVTLVYKKSAISSKGQKKLEVAIEDRARVGTLESILEEPSFTTLRAIYEENNPSSITDGERLYLAIVEYVDDFVNTGFLKGNISLLAAFKEVQESDNLGYLTDKLLAVANSSAFVNTVYNEYETNNPDNLTLYSFLQTQNYYNDKLGDRAERFYYDKASNSLRSINEPLIGVLNDIVAAEQIVTGEIFKSVIKNAEGNNIPNSRISNLASLAKTYVAKHITNNPTSSLKQTLFGLNPNMLLGSSIKTDVINRNGVRKSATKFSVAEIGYSSIVYDFYSNLLRPASGSTPKTIYVQPTVYSDKGTFIMFKLGINNIVVQDTDGKEFTINLLTSPVADIHKAVKGTVGNYYKSVFNNVVNDYKEVYRDSLTTYLQRLQENNIDAYNRIVAKQGSVDTDNVKITEHNSKLVVTRDAAIAQMHTFEAMGDYASAGDVMSSIENELIERPLITLADKLDFADFTALLAVTTKSEYNSMSFAKGANNIDNVHTSKGGKFTINGKSKGGLSTNNSLNFYANQMYKNDSTYDRVMLREKKKFIKDMVDNNMSFPLTYADGKPNITVRKASDTLLGASKKDWVNAETQELILAKMGNINITRLSDLDSKWLRDSSEITLNPILDRYFAADFLASENLRLITTGSSIAHPNKTNYGDVNPTSFEGIELEQSSRERAELKRNVISPATLQHFHQNSLLGIPPVYNLAIMSDVEAKVYNFKGESGGVDAHDGSAWCNPIMSYLENFSLQDSAVGEDKKPIGHDYTGKYGTAVLLKFATFSTYNSRMRDSLGSDISLYNMFRKMNNLLWTDSQLDIDLTKNIYGNPMELKDVTNGERIFYRAGTTHYELLGIDKAGVDESGVPTYNIRKQIVDVNGNATKAVGDANVLMDLNVPINSLFDLHQVLGGVYSESLVKGELSFGDASIAVAANYVNNVGTYNNNGDIPTQLNTRQPLKQQMIAYLVNKSAIKVGAQNINGDNAWFDDSQLMTMDFATDGLGIQMDADHTVVDGDHQSTMTEFSQVVSALESLGFTHNLAKQVYKNLGQVALSSIGGVRDAVHTLTGLKQTENPDVKSDLYEIVGKSIIKELNKDGNELGTAKTIISKAKKEFALDKKKKVSHGADENKIPFSDPSIFGKVLSTFTSNVNKTAIKRKFQGMGAVMAPGYNIMQVFRLGGLNYKFTDIYNIAAKEGITPEEWLANKQAEIEAAPASTIDRLIPGDRIKLSLQEVAAVVSGINSNALKNVVFAELDVKKYTKEVTKASAATNDGTALAKAQDNLNKATNKLATINSNKTLSVADYIKDKGWQVEGEYALVYINDFDTYNTIKSNFSTFYTDITRPTDLKPAEVYWEDATGTRHSIFDTVAVQRSFSERTKFKGGKLPKDLDAKIQSDVQKTFVLLEQGYMIATGAMQLEYNQDPVAFSAKYVPEGMSMMQIEDTVAVPIQNLVNNPAEIVISKMYLEQFNLSANDSINDVMSQGADFFVDRYDKFHAPKTKWYDMMFTRGNGKHVYIAFGSSNTILENLAINKSLTDEDFARSENSVFRLDKEGNTMYESGYYDADGIYHELVTSYNAVGENTVEEVLVVNTPDSILDIYKIDDFDSVRISQYAKDKNLVKEMLELTKDRNDKLLTDLYKTYAASGEEFSISKLAYELSALEKTRKIKDAQKKFVSFQKSLEYTVARIPAQTMQSFMKMKAVAFNESSKNVVQVSHWQTW